MRVLSEARLKQFWSASPQQARGKKPLRLWLAKTKQAGWLTPADAKLTFGKNVDFVQSARGSDLAVFNIHGNHYRLIAAVHYIPQRPQRGRVYVLRILTHEEYDKNRWKEEL